ncbi:MAG: nitrilase-related carbon-nitrogen hydrolase [Planctomycetaceae bacterium]
MKVALVETDTVWEDEKANRRAVEEALPPADLAVYPELTFSGFTMNPRVDARAEPFLRELAGRTGTYVAAGYVAKGPANTAGMAAPDGTILARYSKLHPFRVAGEHEHYVRGDEMPVIPVRGFQIAMLICYDLRFPEAFRDAALRGADLFLVLANWPAERIAHWSTLLRARAIENQAYVVGVNRVGKDPAHSYPGLSLAVDPLGEVLREGAGTVELDPLKPTRLRNKFPALKDVRTDRYRLGPA